MAQTSYELNRKRRGEQYSGRDAGSSSPAKTAGADEETDLPEKNALVDCGWGRLLFGQTFEDPADLVAAMREERPDKRDIAAYIAEPHVVLSIAPQELFLDPSHTFRLKLADYEPADLSGNGFVIRRLESARDAEQVNAIYAARNMVPVPPEFFYSLGDSKALTMLVAEDETSGTILGSVTGVNHARVFSDADRGTSLWCLAVDPQARQPRIGEALVRSLAEHFRERGARYLDLSVLHNNEQAIALYEKLGFYRVPFFTVKRKNQINEKLFIGPDRIEGLNPYAEIIVNEAMRRGIHVEVTDAEGGFFRLTHGGRSIHCRESLSELTSGVAVSICDDKSVTRRIVEAAGVKVPAQLYCSSSGRADDGRLDRFLAAHEAVVVKPARGEQGRGVAVGLTSREDVDRAIESARTVSDGVVIEEMVEGMDLRIIVIGFAAVAAAVRRPARVIGNGVSTIRELIKKQSRRREAATHGESRIPLDGETERAVRRAGFSMDDVLEAGLEIEVRKTANLHTGGTIHDVTDILHPQLVDAAVTVARAIDIPVVGVDFIVKAPTGPDYAFIEANERPGLANHEPQPTAERFVDLLFPHSIPVAARQVWARGHDAKA